MRPVRDFGVDNKRWILFALILLVASVAVVLRSANWYPFAQGPRGAVALLPGLTVENAPPAHQGLIVTSVQSDSESARSGIVAGDDIEGLDGHPVKNLGGAINYLKKDQASAIVLEVAHGQVTHDVRLRRLKEVHHGT